MGGGKKNDLKGKTFGRLKVLGRAPYSIRPDGKRDSQWYCECSCEKHPVIVVRECNLLSGHTLSCGCYVQEKNTKHDMSHSKEYHEWIYIKGRCNNPCTNEYEHYGGRGISVAPEWQNDFMAFYKYVISLPLGNRQIFM